MTVSYFLDILERSSQRNLRLQYEGPSQKYVGAQVRVQTLQWGGEVLTNLVEMRRYEGSKKSCRKMQSCCKVTHLKARLVVRRFMGEKMEFATQSIGSYSYYM